MIQINVDSQVFNKAYLPYVQDYKHRFEVYYGGAGSGKSVFVAQKLILKALQSKRIILVVRKTLASQSKSCWKLLLDTIDTWGLNKYCKINRSDYRIELCNGSLFYVVGIDNSERIKSIVGVTDIWCEEATELTPDDFDQLNLRMRAKAENQQIILSFNPISKVNWVYKRWFDKDAVVDEDTFILKTTYKDNKFLPPDYVKALENMIRTNPTYYRVYALGEFCSLDKLVYSNWKIQEFDYTQIDGQLCIGLDFGFSADTTALIASIVTKDAVYIFREWGNTGLTNPDIANGIQALGYSKSVIIADCAEPKSIEEIRRAGIRRIKESVKGPDSIIHGIQRLQQYDIYVHPSCVETITELENYSWQKDKQTNEYINKPVDLFNHYLDALRYSLQCIDVKKIGTMSKEKLGL